MEKKRLFKILSKAESEKVAELGKKIRDKYPVTVIKKPEKTLAMIKMREPVQNSLFYLGEVIISEASVSIDGTVGRAAAMGDDFEKTLNMAVIDAACNKGIFEDEKILLEWEAKQNEITEKENAMLQKNKGEFSLYGFGGDGRILSTILTRYLILKEYSASFLKLCQIREELFRYQKKRTGFSETSHHFLQLQ